MPDGIRIQPELLKCLLWVQATKQKVAYNFHCLFIWESKHISKNSKSIVINILYRGNYKFLHNLI